MGDGMEGVKAAWISEGKVVGVSINAYFKELVQVVANPGIGEPYLTFNLPKSMSVHLGDRVVISVHVMEPGVE